MEGLLWAPTLRDCGPQLTWGCGGRCGPSYVWRRGWRLGEKEVGCKDELADGDGELAPTGVVHRVGWRDVDSIGNGEWRQGLCELARGMGALPGS